MATTTVSLAAIRRLAASTQAYAPRFRRARAGEVEEAIRRLGARLARVLGLEEVRHA